jgi:hypothetical protein
MCPACMANIILVTTGATSSGGVTAFALSKFYRRKQINRNKENQNEPARNGTQNGNKTDEPSRNRIGS